MVHLAGHDRLADESNTRILLEHPGAALAHAAILQYRPVNTDVLPLFVVCHLLFAPLLWLLLRVPNATLGASLLLYALVQVFDWTVPAYPNSVWFFNLLAWQLLVVLGAWWVIEGRKFWPWATSRTALILALWILWAHNFSITAWIVAFICDENARLRSAYSNWKGARHAQLASFRTGRDRLRTPPRRGSKAAREAAELLPPGAVRDAALRRARQAETGSRISEWLRSPGLQPPK